MNVEFMNMNNGYFAVVLNKKSCVEVGRKATMDIKVSKKKLRFQ